VHENVLLLKILKLMRKLFTLCLFLTIVLGANATQRKTWDFTKGFSDATIQQIAADVAAAKGWTEETASQSYQCGSKTKDTELTANGSVISETAGLLFGTTSAKHVVIAYNYTKTAYATTSFLWLNGKNTTDYFTIPKVGPGQKIAITHESHSLTEARGFTCSTSGVTLLSGNETSTTGTETTVWQVNDTNADSIAVTFKTVTGGAHIQSIIIDEGDAPIVKDDSKIAYLFDSSFSGYDEGSDPIRTLLSEKNTTNFDIKDFTADGAGVITTDSLQKFDMVVLSDAIAPTHAFVPSLKKLVRYVPMINLNASLYDTWGFAKLINPATATGSMVVVDSMKTSSLFTNVNIEADGSVNMMPNAITGNMMQSYTAAAGSYFANDSIYTTVDGVNAIHRHGTKSNAYLLIPMTYEGIANNNVSEDAINIFSNAINIISATKSEVTNTITPSITTTYGDHTTAVKISCATPDSKIYYTTDGTDPTTASNLYTGELTFTDSLDIKAFAVADGYYDSSIKDYGKVAIQSQIAVPTYTIDKQAGYTTMKLNNIEEGASIYYNLTGSNATATSVLYVDTIPVTFKKHATVTIFATKNGMVTSNTTSFKVAVNGETLRLDTLEHITFNDAAWTTAIAAGSDFITGKYYNFWSTTKVDSTSTTYKDINGNDSVVWKFTYAPKDSLTTVDFGNGWMIGSYGQRMMIQTTGPSTNVDTDYGPETAFDFGATKYALSFLVTKNSSDPANAYLQSTKTFKGPFDINVWLCGQYAEKSYEAVEVSVSKDSVNWTVIDTIGTSRLKRMHKGDISYEGNDNVYVKIKSANASASKQKTMIFDVMLMYAGPITTDVKDIKDSSSTVVATQYYSISGARIGHATKGINIVKDIYSDGSSKARKIIVR
jgi:hypothetical protein